MMGDWDKKRKIMHSDEFRSQKGRIEDFLENVHSGKRRKTEQKGPGYRPPTQMETDEPQEHKVAEEQKVAGKPDYDVDVKKTETVPDYEVDVKKSGKHERMPEYKIDVPDTPDATPERTGLSRMYQEAEAAPTPVGTASRFRELAGYEATPAVQDDPVTQSSPRRTIEAPARRTIEGSPEEVTESRFRGTPHKLGFETAATPISTPMPSSPRRTIEVPARRTIVGDAPPTVYSDEPEPEQGRPTFAATPQRLSFDEDAPDSPESKMPEPIQRPPSPISVERRREFKKGIDPSEQRALRQDSALRERKKRRGETMEKRRKGEEGEDVPETEMEQVPEQMEADTEEPPPPQSGIVTPVRAAQLQSVGVANERARQAKQFQSFVDLHGGMENLSGQQQQHQQFQETLTANLSAQARQQRESQQLQQAHVAAASRRQEAEIARNVSQQRAQQAQEPARRLAEKRATKTKTQDKKAQRQKVKDAARTFAAAQTKALPGEGQIKLPKHRPRPGLAAITAMIRSGELKEKTWETMTAAERRSHPEYKPATADERLTQASGIPPVVAKPVPSSQPQSANPVAKPVVRKRAKAQVAQSRAMFRTGMTALKAQQRRLGIKTQEPVTIAPQPPLPPHRKPPPPAFRIPPKKAPALRIQPQRPVGIAPKRKPPTSLSVQSQQPVGIAPKRKPPTSLRVQAQKPVGIAPKRRTLHASSSSVSRPVEKKAPKPAPAPKRVRFVEGRGRGSGSDMKVAPTQQVTVTPTQQAGGQGAGIGDLTRKIDELLKQRDQKKRKGAQKKAYTDAKKQFKALRKQQIAKVKASNKEIKKVELVKIRKLPAKQRPGAKKKLRDFLKDREQKIKESMPSKITSPAQLSSMLAKFKVLKV